MHIYFCVRISGRTATENTYKQMNIMNNFFDDLHLKCLINA